MDASLRLTPRELCREALTRAYHIHDDLVSGSIDVDDTLRAIHSGVPYRPTKSDLRMAIRYARFLSWLPFSAAARKDDMSWSTRIVYDLEMPVWRGKSIVGRDLEASIDRAAATIASLALWRSLDHSVI